MKNLIFYSKFLIICFLISCDSDSDGVSVSACINADKETVEVGETVTITNCSSNFTSFEYSYFDSLESQNATSTESTLELSFSRPGDYIVSIEASDDDGNTNTSQISITVNEFTDKLILIDIPDDFQSIPLSAGIDETTGNFYYVDIFGESTGNDGYYYKELNGDYEEISNTFLRDRTENGGSAFRESLPNGDKTITMINSFSSSYFSRQITLNSTGGVSVDFTGIRVIYGNLDFNGNKIYFGAEIESNNNFPAIEIRDTDNNILETRIYTDLGFEKAIISDMIALDDGYVAFGGSFENDGNRINNYTPLLIFFDSDLEIIETKTYPDTQLISSDVFVSFDSLNDFMHIEKLSSGNIVTYGLGELRVTDSNGQELFSELTTNSSSNGGVLLNLGDSFIVSKRGYLTKYDASGNVIKEIYTNGDIATNLTLDGDKVVFISAFQSTDSNNISIFVPFIGAVDTDLNFIDLNN